MESLYQEKILNWAKQSRTVAPLSGACHSAIISNPLCGDRVEVCLHINADNIISDVSTAVRGCALCEAGAGLFASLAPGMTATSLPALQTGFSDWLAGDDNAVTAAAMNDFMPIRSIKNRQKCVVLAFEAGSAAIKTNPNC
tara:strand:+ start:177 stop:599 length:423 start_codon:yes stop_codon:yes gene_type:complete